MRVGNHESKALVLWHYLDPFVPPTPAARVFFNRLVSAPRVLPVSASPIAIPVGNALPGPSPTLPRS
jgi:hypothetical protein